MSKNKIEKAIREKAKKDVPDVLDSIKNTPEYQHFMDEANASRKPGFLKRFVPVLASMTALFILGIFLFNPNDPGTDPGITSNVQMEINPSFSIGLSEEDTVVELTAYNSDAEDFLSEKDTIIGQDLDTAIDRLITRAIDMGYMSEENSDVLFSVSGEDSEKSEALRVKIEQKVPEVAARNGVNNAHMMRSVAGPPGEGEIESAQEHGMGFMQWRLVNLILNETDGYTMEELEDKNVGELKAILREESIDQDDFQGPMQGQPGNDTMPHDGMPGGNDNVPGGSNGMPNQS